MAITDIPLLDVLTHDAKVIAPIAAATNMSFQNGGATRLVIVSDATATGSGTVTIKGVQDSNRRTGDVVLTIPISSVIETGFFEVSLFCNGGTVFVDFSSVTGVKVTAVRQQL